MVTHNSRSLGKSCLRDNLRPASQICSDSRHETLNNAFHISIRDKIYTIVCFDTMKIYHVCDVNLVLHLDDTRSINGLTVYFLPIKVLAKYGRST